MRTKLILFVFLLFNLAPSLNSQEFFTQNLLSNLNNHPNGFSAYAHHISQNTPNGYGTLLGFRFWDGGGSDWRTQLAFGTENDFYYRQSTNSSGNTWTDWCKVWHSGNLNRHDVDFKANKLITKELAIYSDESAGGWGITHLYWKGHSLILGSPQGSYVHNAVVFRPGGSYTAGQVCHNFFNLQKAISVDNYETCVQFATDGSLNYIRYGNFLIGKDIQTNTAYKLDVAGKIRDDEIVVNTTGADFVFEPTYKLRSLSELETFIRTNKHLPDIAPAKEMQENGISAGEMQAKLLQKVEELTLYVIEQSKQIETLKSENNQLKLDKGLQLKVQQELNSEFQKTIVKMKKEIESLKRKINNYTNEI